MSSATRGEALPLLPGDSATTSLEWPAAPFEGFFLLKAALRLTRSSVRRRAASYFSEHGCFTPQTGKPIPSLWHHFAARSGRSMRAG
jgi:hypothetical protein